MYVERPRDYDEFKVCYNSFARFNAAYRHLREIQALAL
jgi:hypothetical protein